jgi:hypothetical protein
MMSPLCGGTPNPTQRHLEGATIRVTRGTAHLNGICSTYRYVVFIEEKVRRHEAYVCFEPSHPATTAVDQIRRLIGSVVDASSRS